MHHPSSWSGTCVTHAPRRRFVAQTSLRAQTRLTYRAPDLDRAREGLALALVVQAGPGPAVLMARTIVCSARARRRQRRLGAMLGGQSGTCSRLIGGRATLTLFFNSTIGIRMIQSATAMGMLAMSYAILVYIGRMNIMIFHSICVMLGRETE